jgi:hypothetical protein
MINGYSHNSPYKDTPVNNNFLDIYVPRNVPSLADDVLIEVPSQFENRPDLLAFEAYGDAGLWWVFAVRNPSVIKDPIYDLVSGVRIYIPQKQALLSMLGTSR